jgi:Na+/H+ antiporter NhaD/arsenite permease-like protein
MTLDAWLAGGIFVAAYLLIALERFDRTLIALLGGFAVIAIGIIDQHEAFAAIDLNVIFLLAGMMVIAEILGRTGLFEWLAARAVRASKGEPARLLPLLGIVTAFLSAFLDNVTTVVLMTPVTIAISARLGRRPLPFLLTVVFASNIGGTATLIGDPPNILIGSAAGLDFPAFLVNLGPATLMIIAVVLLVLPWVLRGELRGGGHARDAAPLSAAAEAALIRDRGLLARGLVVALATVIGFLLHSLLHVEAATVAMLGATVLMLLARSHVEETLREIEWSTLFFFVGLFVLVEGVVHVGIIRGIADGLAGAVGGNVALASVGLLWFSAIASAIVDNIPYTATAIPVVQRLVEAGLPAEALWWSLALGACLGGNLTIVGASANVVATNMAAAAGHPISFGQFLRYGSVVVVISLVISTGYVLVRYA